jgi:hypothetical protein
MPILRLAYATQFLIALITVFVLWSQIGQQTHLDLIPWYLKVGLGGGAAFAVVKATAAAVGGQSPWNGRTLKWLGILFVMLVGCGLSSYYVHLYGETDEEDEGQTSNLPLARPASAVPPLSRSREQADLVFRDAGVYLIAPGQNSAHYVTDVLETGLA